MPLEFTMDPLLFSVPDDSKEKISMNSLFLIFVIWGAGMIFTLVTFATELVVWKITHRKPKGRKVFVS